MALIAASIRPASGNVGVASDRHDPGVIRVRRVQFPEVVAVVRENGPTEGCRAGE